MIRTKVITSFAYGIFNLYFPKMNTPIPNVIELDQFIADVSYENIRQILVSPVLGFTRYTVLYEDGLDALPPYKLCPRCHAQLDRFDTQCQYCRLKNIP